jgi:hypothetical protein
VALGWLWGRNPLAINTLWGGFDVALGGFTRGHVGDLPAPGQPLHNGRVLCHEGPQYPPLRHYRGLLLHAPLYAISVEGEHARGPKRGTMYRQWHEQRRGGGPVSGTGVTSLGAVPKLRTLLPRRTRNAVSHATLLVARSKLVVSVRWQRSRGRVAALYFRRFTLPVPLWPACGFPSQLRACGKLPEATFKRHAPVGS